MKFLEAVEEWLNFAIKNVSTDDYEEGRVMAYNETLAIIAMLKKLGDRETDTRFRNMEDTDIRLPTS